MGYGDSGVAESPESHKAKRFSEMLIPEPKNLGGLLFALFGCGVVKATSSGKESNFSPINVGKNHSNRFPAF